MEQVSKIEYVREILLRERSTEFSAAQLQAGAAAGGVALLQEYLLDHVVTEAGPIDDGVLRASGTSKAQRARITILGLAEMTSAALATLRRMALEAGREHVCYCLLPNSQCDLSVHEEFRTAPALAATIIPFYPNDLLAIVDGKAGIQELYEYKLYRRFLQEKSDPETQFSDLTYRQFYRTKSQADAAGSISTDYRPGHSSGGLLVQHPSLGQITQSLDLNRGCLLVGPSSSGKTILAEQLMDRQAARGHSVAYIDLRSQFGEYATIYTALVASNNDRPLCFVVDDLQSNPSVARYIITLVSAWRRVTTGIRPLLVGMCWPEFARQVVAWFEDCRPLTIYPQQVRDQLLARAQSLSPTILNAIKEQYGDDLLLLSLFLNEAVRTQREPTPEAVIETIWDERTAGVDEHHAKTIGLIVSALGRFDIAAPTNFVEFQALVRQADISALIESGLLRKTGALLSVGHRSLAGLICDWISTGETWKTLHAKNGPANVEEVVLRYIQSSDTALAIETLRGLQARVGFKKEDQLNVRAAAIVSIWQVFNTIVERLEVQQEIDPTWGGAPSSAMFAAQTFAEIGRDKDIEGSLRFLRECWSIVDGRIEVAIEKLSTRHDFAKIRERMLKEDEVEHRWKAASLAANQVDIDRFHRTWVLGLILGSEAASGTPRLPLPQLAEMVEEEAISNVAFYPQRVPWCTARVLLGLAACGRTINTSETVKRCTQWLLRSTEEGGACKNGVWESGTGTWNSTIETTAMVLVALTAVGVDWTDPSLMAARSYLISNRTQWTSAGKEMDGALALQAYMDTGGNWEDIAPEVQRLCQWGKAEAVWQGATRSAEDSLEQSCRVAQIASHLIDIGWSAIRTDLPAFLDALATPQIRWNSTPSESRVTTPAYSKVAAPELASDRELVALRSLSRLSVEDTAVVGEYCRFDERTRNQLIDRVTQVSRGLETKNIVHENFLIWAAPGTGKSFLIQQIAKSLGDKIKYVEVNFASLSREEIAARLAEIKASTEPTLVLYDEVDSRPSEPWLYEDTFTSLDLNLSATSRIVFVLIGSSPLGLVSMKNAMKSRSKGQDLLSRIPPENQFEIPTPMVEDKVAIVAAQVAAASREKKVVIRQIEKLALYYALKNDALTSPRHLRDLIQVAALRIVGADTRLRYDHLFNLGDRRNQNFWTSNVDAAEELSDVYVNIA